MELEPSTAAAGLAARLAAIQHRKEHQRPLQCDEWVCATGAAAGQQQGSHLDIGAAAGSSVVGGSSDRGDVMTRLAVLQGRLTGGVAADSSGDQPTAANAQHSSPAAAEVAASSMLERLHILQRRQASQVGDGMQECSAGSAVQDDAMQRPEDFLDCMKSLLARENFSVPLEENDDDGNDDVSVAGAMQGQHVSTACGEQQADAGSGSPMCVSPHGCGKQQCATQKVAEISTQQQQQQQQWQATGLSPGRQQHQQQQDYPAVQHQQQDEAPAFEAMIPGHVRRLLVLAAQSLSAQQYTEARARAAAAQQAAAALDCTGASGNSSSAISSFCKDAEKLQAVAVLLEHVPQQQWFAALQLPGPSGSWPHQSAAAAAAGSSASTQAVQRAYRRLAGLVHPDKCRHPCAESAFKALTTAYEQALAGLGAQGQDSCFTADDLSTGLHDEFGDNPWDGAGTDYTWWSEWERDVSAGHVDGAAAAAGGGGGVGSGSSEPAPADEEELLWRVSMQELVVEVERRQASVLRPLSPTDQARQPAERQKRLRVARTVLSARMQQHRQAAMVVAAAGDDDDDFDTGSGVGLAGGGFVADADDWTGHKRQRL